METEKIEKIEAPIGVFPGEKKINDAEYISKEGVKSPTKEKWKEELQYITGIVYPDDRFDVRISGDIVSILIHFPEVLIQNNRNESHTCKDIFIRLTFGYLSYKLTQFEIAKTTYHINEYESRYLHSHVNGGNVGTYNSSCCFGSTEISNVREKLKSQYSAFLFERFLGLIPVWLSHESLEGTPYIYMKDVKAKDRYTKSVTALTNADILENNLFKFLSKFVIKLNINDKSDICKIELDNEYVNSVINEISSHKALYNPENKSYYGLPEKAANYDMQFKNFNRDCQVIFKGKTVPVKIEYPNEGVVYNTVAHPSIKNIIINTLNQIIDATVKKNDRIKLVE